MGFHLQFPVYPPFWSLSNSEATCDTLYLDSTQMQANASVHSLKPRFAIEAHLSNLFSEEGEAQQQSSAKDDVRGGVAPDDVLSCEDGHQTSQIERDLSRVLLLHFQ